MSALIGVCATEQAWIMTDAAGVGATDGILADIRSKITVSPVAVFAWTGSRPPVERFVEACQHRAHNFDELVDAEIAPRIWRAIRQTWPAPRGFAYSVLLVGWSEQRRQLEMYALDSRQDPNGAELVVYCHGAYAESDIAETTEAFCRPAPRCRHAG